MERDRSIPSGRCCGGCGIADRLGTIEAGKDADISVFTGHPVTTYAARVKYSMVNGEVIF